MNDIRLTVEDVTNKIISSELKIPSTGILPQLSIRNDLGADSLDIALIIMMVEKKFSIFIPEEEVHRIDTIQNLYDTISESLQAV